MKRLTTRRLAPTASTPPARPLRARRGAAALLTVAAIACVLTAGGCELAAIAMRGDRTVKVEAQYDGLAGRSVAVVVAADEQLLFTQPRVVELVGRGVANELAANVEGVRVANPAEIAAFQQANPYWTTTPYTDLIAALGVERMIVLDLAEYRLHEPGNRHEWKGVISASVSVVEGEAADPDQLAFQSNVRATFPEDREVGLINARRDVIELATLKLFTTRAGQVFYDHEVEQ